MGKKSRRDKRNGMSSGTGKAGNGYQALLRSALQAQAAQQGMLTSTAPGGVSRMTQCVHIALISHACIVIIAHVLLPQQLAFLTPYLLVLSSVALLAGCAGAPLPGWRSRVAAILVDDWRVPIVAVLVWVTLGIGYGTQLGKSTQPSVFGQHVWVGAAAVQGLCAVVLEYNLSSLGNGGDPVISVGGVSSTPSKARRSDTTGAPSSGKSDSSHTSGWAGEQAPKPAGEPEIYGNRRPLLYVVTDVAAFIHGILWFCVISATQTVSLVFVQWIAVVVLCSEALYKSAMVRLPVLRYHGIMWTGAVCCLTLYGWETSWEFPVLPLLTMPSQQLVGAVE